ncbi:conserved hypothetical protein [Phenylobacterium zucineum HLK1]|uniref:Glycosyl transferase family 1 domain-containing protein n=1 Tax=Phenylobacterium zucineum (strain HLK1) TaxID=450851 RepID=B4RC14_PHEZH|nr:glycosyltransferase [Phenylobacterium zucineum]ACG79807.1 conserved hypothetical protein [Phenylobacterium zucineum HLK1]
MSRIVYLGFPTGAVSGGQKVILRHVEALRELGFDAVYWRRADNVLPTWLDHKAPVEADTPFRPDDILVLPTDAPNAMEAVATRLPNRALLFCQNQYSLLNIGLAPANRFPAERAPDFIVPGPLIARSIQRLFPRARVEVIPCFADERIFVPGAERRHAVATVPRKRPGEMNMVRNYLRQVHPRHAELPWIPIEGATEAQIAGVFGASTLCLSLSRFESVGMTPLEAMACGCVVAGFTGIGGWDFATPQNGFWAPEDDVEAAGEALARAADLVLTGGPALSSMLEAGRATAEQWSYARFRTALEEVWMRLAPEARLRDGPLD